MAFSFLEYTRFFPNFPPPSGAGAGCFAGSGVGAGGCFAGLGVGVGAGCFVGSGAGAGGLTGSGATCSSCSMFPSVSGSISGPISGPNIIFGNMRVSFSFLTFSP
ncbi:hypothetical protein V8G54_011742 [Vigna mungo]|uniref:Uncharacterized protein n=1 Tax=Vigna mungo TaxID=3915 RepID=A0AAQ3S367_VIGMU